MRFYYLQSRYYGAYVKRFIDADTYLSTGTGFIGNNAYAYCDNNPIIGMDTSGYGVINAFARMMECGNGISLEGNYSKISITVFSCSDDAWLNSSRVMGESLGNIFGTSAIIVIQANKTTFISEWNKCMSDFVIIHTHGSAKSLNDQVGETTPKIADIAMLHLLNYNPHIQKIIMTACSTGGDNGTNDNVGMALSRKCPGYVICGTGIVTGDKKVFNVSNSNNWIVYHNGDNSRSTGIKKRTVSLEELFYECY